MTSTTKTYQLASYPKITRHTPQYAYNSPNMSYLTYGQSWSPMPKVEAIARYPQLPSTHLLHEHYKVANILEMQICTPQSYLIISLPPLAFSFVLMM